MAEAQAPVSDNVAVGVGVKIVEAAKAAAKAAQSTPYTVGGKTTSGFDCSGFVYYVYQKVIPEYEYLTAAGIAASRLFSAVTAAQAGDVIYFPPGPNPYEVNKGNEREYPAHVGIIVDDSWWIGRQTGAIGLVSRSNVWWKDRGVRFFRYVGAKQVSVRFLQHRGQLRHA